MVRKGEPQRKLEWDSQGHLVTNDAVTRSLLQQARLVRMSFVRRKTRVSVVAGVTASLLLTLLSAMTFAQEKTECALPDCDQAKAFFSKFQKAIEADQKTEVVAMVRYPLRSYDNGKATLFKTKAQLMAAYDSVFTSAVRCAIQSATLSDVWGNWRGFTISTGAIWWDRDIPSSARNVQTSDVSKYPFGVFGVNHGQETVKTCPANQDVPVQP